MIFAKEQLKEFLRKIDQELKSNVELHIIGGAAAALAYDSKKGTRDIDTWRMEEAIQEAYEQVKKKYPDLALPFGPAYVHIQSPAVLKRFVPYSELNLSKLTIKVPEAEDLFLLKAQRADEKDIDDLIELNRSEKLDSQKILLRFKNDILPDNYGNDGFLVDNYLFCVDKIFGTEVATKHQKDIQIK